MTLLNRNRCSDRRYCRGLCFWARSALGSKDEVSQLYRLRSTDTSQDSLAEQILDPYDVSEALVKLVEAPLAL
jgi:hypothetical protein